MADKGEQNLHVHLPKDKSLPISSEALSDAIIESLSYENKSPARDLHELVQGVIHLEYESTKRRMKRNLDILGGGSGVESVSIKDTEELAVQLIEDMLGLLEKANYKLMTQSEWRAARSDDFEIQLPMSIKWEALDTTTLRNVWDRADESKAILDKDNRPSFATHALLFRRGSSVSTQNGRFINHKLDLIAEKVVLFPFLTLLAAIGLRKRSGDEKPLRYNASVGEENNEETVEVQRQTLRQLYPTLLKLVIGLVRKDRLYEPTYKEVVILYRPTETKGKKKEANSIAGPVELRSFRDVPMADVELCFPETKIYPRSFHRVQVWLTVIATLLSFAWSYFKGSFDTGSMALLTALVSRLMQQYTMITSSKNAVASQLSNLLRSKGVDAQEGVLLTLLDSMEEQETKETMVGYFALLKSGRAAISKRVMKQKGEELLSEVCDIHSVSFDAEDAISKLLNSGLAIDNNDGTITANAISGALDELNAKCKANFEPNQGDSSPKEGAKKKLSGQVFGKRSKGRESKADGGGKKQTSTSMTGVGTSHAEAERLRRQQRVLCDKVKELERTLDEYLPGIAQKVTREVN